MIADRLRQQLALSAPDDRRRYTPCTSTACPTLMALRATGSRCATLAGWLTVLVGFGSPSADGSDRQAPAIVLIPPPTSDAVGDLIGERPAYFRQAGLVLAREGFVVYVPRDIGVGPRATGLGLSAPPWLMRSGASPAGRLPG